jgi:hypothetical protein
MNRTGSPVAIAAASCSGAPAGYVESSNSWMNHAYRSARSSNSADVVAHHVASAMSHSFSRASLNVNTGVSASAR